MSKKISLLLMALTISSCASAPPRAPLIVRSPASEELAFTCSKEDDVYLFLAKFGEIYRYQEGKEKWNGDGYTFEQKLKNDQIFYGFKQIDSGPDFLIVLSQRGEFVRFSKDGKRLPDYQCKIVPHSEAVEMQKELSSPNSMPR